MKAKIKGSSIFISNCGNSAALLLEWIAAKGERMTIRAKLHNDDLESFLEVTIFLGATSAYSISYVDYCDLRDYINGNIISEAA